jgi:hypothetical protein
MEIILLETEYKSMMPRAKHNKECSKYQKKIKALQTKISKLESQYKAIAEEPINESDDPIEELPILLDYVINNAKRIILSLVEEQDGEINDIYFEVIYNHDDNKDYTECMLTGINSEGKLTIENKKATYLDKLTPDSLYKLVDDLSDHCKK